MFDRELDYFGVTPVNDREKLFIVSHYTGNQFALAVQVRRTETIKEVEQAILERSEELHLGKSPEFRFYSGIRGANKHESHLSGKVTIESLLAMQHVENVNDLNIYVKKLCKRKRVWRWK